MAKPFSLRLDDELDSRLERLAKETGRTKTYYVRAAILEHLADLEDVYLAEQVLERIRQGKEQTSTLDEVGQRLDLED